jgi:predicted NAD/FAD-binding protein
MASTRDSRPRRIAIIGAGVTGLLAAQGLSMVRHSGGHSALAGADRPEWVRCDCI